MKMLMSDLIQQNIKAEPNSNVTVIGRLDSRGDNDEILPVEKVLLLSAEQCSGTRLRVGNKYKPSLYVKRANDSQVLSFLSATNPQSGRALIMVERAGSGKTNLVCSLSEQLPKIGVPSVFLLGSDVIRDPFQLRDEAISVFGISRPRAFPQKKIGDFLKTIGRSFCILIDAFNEARDLELFKEALLELFSSFADLPVRILGTCRDIYWSFVEDEWTERLNTDVRTFGMYHYDNEAWPSARNRYFEAYQIQGTLADDADEKCRHPLLFRFFCEAYEGENVSTVHEIRLRPLFERYLAKKVKKLTRGQPPRLRAEEKTVRILLGIASEIISTQETTVHESRMPQITGDRDYLDRESLYVRLLDEDIMLEEVPDERRDVLSRRVRFVYEAFLEFMIAKLLEEKWANVTNTQILASLEELLEPTACVRNVLGALSYLTGFFEERSLNIWEVFALRGPIWQNVAVQAIGETDPRELGKLHHEAFKALLKSSNHETRAAVIRLLKNPERADILDPGHLLLFKSLKSDRNYKVRLAAHEVLQGLWKSLSTSEKCTVAEAAFDRAKEVREVGKDTVRKFYKEIRKKFLDRIRRALASDDGKIRSYAAAILDLHRWPEGRDLLLKGLTDQYHWVRSACLIGLQDYPREEDAPAVAFLLDDQEPRIRSLAAILCKKWAFPSFYQPLVSRTEVEGNESVLSRLIGALVALKVEQSLPVFKKFLSHHHYWVFHNSVRGVLELSRLNHIERLLHLAQERQMTMWPASWYILGYLGGTVGLEKHCFSGFASVHFSAATGAILGGLYAAECAFPERKKRGPYLVTNDHFIEWTASFLRNDSIALRRSFLMGLCLSSCRGLPELVNVPAVRVALNEVILGDDDILSGLAVRLVARVGGPVSHEESDRVLNASSPSARLEFALGLCYCLRFAWATEEEEELDDKDGSTQTSSNLVGRLADPYEDDDIPF